MKKLFCFLSFLLPVNFLFAQFPPPAGQPGTTAMHKDSSAFVAWATGCSVTPGWQDIDNTSIGYANAGDSTMALGQAGTNGTVSLGDGGEAILAFVNPVTDGPGWDFAVFENSFSSTFLELAYVEVSSDGISFHRFPCTSYTQDTAQVNGFGSINATQIDNLAGKYEALYGTPFDLQELAGIAGLNINAVTHVKVIDVVGCIQDQYARYDRYGNKINDPWNTPFPSSGFDLDAVGVIHEASTGLNEFSHTDFSFYPNPAADAVHIRFTRPETGIIKISILDCSGKEVKRAYAGDLKNYRLPLGDIRSGFYFISVETSTGSGIQKLIISHENKE